MKASPRQQEKTTLGPLKTHKKAARPMCNVMAPRRKPGRLDGGDPCLISLSCEQLVRIWVVPDPSIVYINSESCTASFTVRAVGLLQSTSEVHFTILISSNMNVITSNSLDLIVFRLES
ncbi:hypothetical protein RRG08_040760 [Elysia crispata]|uniref:Uncharacterized protein n=1 Tax=Elysia crispata TaxID=231223 RepID=A0AAE1EGJ0_9GAST|nr:hypothetical protein RRG08_040760 [Elysia crispata]